MGILLEVCVDDAAGIEAAARGGAQRIELCAALALGGLTPSAGLMALAAGAALPAMAMIRPRAGDFVWSGDEIRAMRAEIAAARAAGLAGVVIGASLPDGRLDARALAALMEEARGLDVTLHRAIDLVPDVAEAMALVRDLGIARVLTSGAAPRAEGGIGRLAAMQGAGVIVMPGGGVTAANVGALDRALGLREVHASCSSPAPVPADPKVTAFGFALAGAKATDAGKVAGLRAALDALRR